MTLDGWWRGRAVGRRQERDDDVEQKAIGSKKKRIVGGRRAPARTTRANRGVGGTGRQEEAAEKKKDDEGEEGEEGDEGEERRQACASRHKSAQSSGGDGTGSTRANGDQRRACNPICAWPICFDVCSSRLLVARPVDARGLMQALLALARARASLHAGPSNGQAEPPVTVRAAAADAAAPAPPPPKMAPVHIDMAGTYYVAPSRATGACSARSEHATPTTLPDYPRLPPAAMPLSFSPPAELQSRDDDRILSPHHSGGGDGGAEGGSLVGKRRHVYGGANAQSSGMGAQPHPVPVPVPSSTRLHLQVKLQRSASLLL
ncbi:uncharacterized protein SETTUDRAFT_32117 [Exserohilum turcica Et28A]|uniref:Uncharacterized protein n=1 Tax=Exserohilum turcicum (strain 28A) TaxID=671987 RepID=R0JV29_EXST2|nr:uncharacterized protein SETTUDRAFT_32117 [Exserohilum turcica Et28A]EOA84878.1 hypothetical protein SETTUDRAFT_32117 [Exserohilum turcica Et28A]